MWRSILLLIPGVLGSVSNLFDWNGCKTSDTTCQCGMPGTSPSGKPTTVAIDEAFCQTMIDAGSALSYVSDGTCKGKCNESIGCYGTDGVNKGHGVCACHVSEATCNTWVGDGKATMWSYRCSNCAPYSSGCYGTDGEKMGHGVCACSMDVVSASTWHGSGVDVERTKKVQMTEEKCQEMVDAGIATMYSHHCNGLCAETLGCYGTDGVDKGHGVCACTLTQDQCETLVADGMATKWSFSCAGLCADTDAEKKQKGKKPCPFKTAVDAAKALYATEEARNAIAAVEDLYELEKKKKVEKFMGSSIEDKMNFTIQRLAHHGDHHHHHHHHRMMGQKPCPFKKAVDAAKELHATEEARKAIAAVEDRYELEKKKVDGVKASAQILV